ncbi:MAG TPA: hypothetical protein VGH65_07210, partial [Verrucomicrobiaceae bacterium]
DGAIRQARDAGITDFVEQTITREKFLRSLGIEVDPRTRVHHDPPPETPAVPETPPAAIPGAWFVPMAGGEARAGTNQYAPSTKPIKQWPSTPPKPATPFAASAPIPLPGDEAIAPPDDVLILPSTQKSKRKKNPFTDDPPAIPGVDELLE